MTPQEAIADVQQRFSMNQGKMPPQHEKLLSLCKRIKQEGQFAVSQREGEMQKADDVYRAFRVPDEDDQKAAERGEPIKIYYPVTYAQIQTAIAVEQAFFNRHPYIELAGRGPTYHRASKLMELVLQYQMDRMGWGLLDYQWKLNKYRYGFGKVNISWEKVEKYRRGKRQVSLLGFDLTNILNIPEDQKIVSYEGNVLENEDPYDLCFDSNVTIGTYQKGSYEVQRRVITYNDLLLLKDQGVFFNIENLPKLKGSDRMTRRDTNQAAFSASSAQIGVGQSITGMANGQPNANSGVVSGGDPVWLDNCYIKLVPKDYELTELDRPQMWLATMANDARIIRAEPCGYEHGQFPSAIQEYSPDLHVPLNDGLAQTIDGLQSLMNWFLNSHVDNVRKVINDVILVDQEAVYIEDIEARRTVWRMKPGYGRQGIDKFVKQFNVMDVTQNHVADAANIFQMIQRTTSVNDNVMGMQLPTRRTATEVQNMQRLASVRMKLQTSLAFIQGIRPLAEQMIQNTQAFMSQEMFVRLSGALAISEGIDPNDQAGLLYAVKPEDIQGQFDIVPVDNNTAMDRQQMGKTLEGFLMSLLKTPEIIPIVGADIAQFAVQILQCAGIQNTTDFLKPPPPDQRDKMIQMLGMLKLAQGGSKPGANGNGARPVEAKVMPDDQVIGNVAKGNLVPAGGPQSAVRN